jgi:hypothetical protein
LVMELPRRTLLTSIHFLFPFLHYTEVENPVQSTSIKCVLKGLCIYIQPLLMWKINKERSCEDPAQCRVLPDTNFYPQLSKTFSN